MDVKGGELCVYYTEMGRGMRCLIWMRKWMMKREGGSYMITIRGRSEFGFYVDRFAVIRVIAWMVALEWEATRQEVA